MNLTKIVNDILQIAAEQPGVTASEIGGTLSSGLSVNVRLGEIDTVEFNRDKSIGITVYKDQRKGSASITDLSEPAIIAAIKAAARIADYTEPDVYSGLAEKELLAKDIKNLQLCYPADINAEQAANFAKECEAAALAYDSRITNSDGASFSTHESNFIYANSNGFIAEYPTSRYYASCVVIGQDSSAMQRDYDYTVARDANDLMAMQQLGIRAAENTVARLNSRKLKTCKASVLLQADMAAVLWGEFIKAISGGNLYRKSSFLLDSLNKPVFPEFINIEEQPHLLKALGSAPFDSEGVATSDKNIITAGILKTYLLSCYSARRLNMQTTGNASGVHNLIIQPGTDDFAGLIKRLNKGLIVTKLLGHGANIVTGDYSQGAAGFWVENGEIQYPVHEITIAGNLRDMFRNMIAVGNDIDKRRNILTGSVLLDEMVIAGD